jgi:DNA-binding transcriptional regulator PaaX
VYNAKLRKEMRKEAQRVPIESIILTTIAVAGLITVAAILPGIAPALQMLGVGKRKSYPKRNVSHALSRLRSKGLIEYREKDGRHYAVLTDKGKERLNIYNKKSAVLRIPKKWDGKWRLVMFDIVEPLRSVRVSLRRELSQAGFVRLQDSVWVYPYDCEEYVALLKADKRIGKSVLYIVAEKVEYDRPLKELFNLR